MDEEDASAIAELYVPDGPVRGLGKRPMLQPRDFEAFQKALLGLVKDVHVAIDRSLEDGEWLSLLCTLSAKCRKTGKPVDITGTCFVRIVDGTAREAYNHWDFIDLYEQLGLLPTDTFSRALGGERLGK